MAKNIEKICRVCLVEVGDGDKSYNIFEKYEDFLVLNTLSEKLIACADVKIKDNDGLPNRICSSCVIELEDAYKFRRKCEKSDVVLRNRLKTNTECYKLNVKEENESDNDDGVPDDSETSVQSDDTKSELKHLLTANIDADDDEQATGEATQPSHVSISTNNVTESKSRKLKLECQDCGETFKSECKLRVHRKRKHLPITCPCCKLQFKSFHAHDYHQKKRPKTCTSMASFRIEGVSKSRHFHCRDCVYNTKSVGNALQHLIVHNKITQYKCDQCDRVFIRSSTLKGHKERTHKQFSGQKTCHICGKVFIGFTKFDSHMRTHKKKCQQVCDICNKSCSSLSSLYTHKKTHSEERPYACNKCPSKFRTSAGLYCHKYKHNGKVYSCKVCGYRAKNPYTVNKHEKEHDGVNVACGECGRFFNTDSELAVHKKSHVKDHPCDYCDKVYAARKNLTEHFRKMHKIYVSSSDSRGVNVKNKKIKLE